MLMRSLSARLLVLTIFFVMLSEVLIFVPSVARFRMTYFENRLAAGHLATMALAASPNGKIDEPLTRLLLADVGAHGVIMHRPNGMVFMLDSPVAPQPDVTFDLTKGNIPIWIQRSLETLARSDNRVMRVLGPAPTEPGATVELLLDEAPLRREMWAFGMRILQLSIVISLITAALVYLSLQWLLVRPMRRITASMTLFREDPEDASRRIVPSGRRDAIGSAENELAMLQETVRQALGQRARLAALGTAVTKINHDLRAILATARLVSDGLADSPAPEVRRVAPRLFDAIDRAVALCTRTLDFSREGRAAVRAHPISAAAADRGARAGRYVANRRQWEGTNVARGDAGRPRRHAGGASRAHRAGRPRPALPGAVEPRAERGRGRRAAFALQRRRGGRGNRDRCRR